MAMSRERRTSTWDASTSMAATRAEQFRGISAMHAKVGKSCFRVGAVETRRRNEGPPIKATRLISGALISGQQQSRLSTTTKNAFPCFNSSAPPRSPVRTRMSPDQPSRTRTFRQVASDKVSKVENEEPDMTPRPIETIHLSNSCDANLARLHPSCSTGAGLRSLWHLGLRTFDLRRTAATNGDRRRIAVDGDPAH
ncbi:hypothetical protein ACVIGB_008406 [Bradyrhizobium sp. USDA 4341]